MEQGTRLNDTYVVLEQLGRGGGGVVYKAYHERLKTYVVVKQVREKVKGILDGRGEADILKKLKHTNLPQVYDFLEIDDEIYTVMDYVPGESLDKVVKRQGAIDPKKVYQWAVQLADALSYLHSQKPAIIHSDIKPANVMLTPKGNVSLIDFNISLAFDDGWRTSTGISGGYSPPEQHRDFNSYVRRMNARGRSGQENPKGGEEQKTDHTRTILEETGADTVVLEETVVSDDKTESLIASVAGSGVDERSDVYSLGATLYHLLTGVKPAENFEEIRPLSSFRLNIGPGFSIIVEKMMELDPGKRYQNGQELFYGLKHVYELDQDFIAYRRSCRLQKILAAALWAGGIGLLGLGLRTMDRERFYAYNRSVEQAGVFLDASRYEEAEVLIEEAIRLLPGRAGAYEKEALRLYGMGDYDEVISYTRDVLNNPPYEISGIEEEKTLGNIFYILGNAYFEKEDYASAMDCFGRALEWNRGNSLYYRDYAVTLAKTGNTGMAEDALKRAVELGLGEDSIYMVQGEIAYAQGENDLAARRLEDSIRWAESEELLKRATFLCAQAYQRMGADYLDREVALLEKSEDRFGADVSMHISEMLADAYARKAEIGKENDTSLEYYRKALDKFEELYEKGYATRQVMENLAILYQQTDGFLEARDMLIQITEQYPGDYRAYKRLAFLEADMQQEKENKDRDYGRMREYSKKAQELYESQEMERDTEMEMLETMVKDLKEGGWFPDA